MVGLTSFFIKDINYIIYINDYNILYAMNNNYLR